MNVEGGRERRLPSSHAALVLDAGPYHAQSI